MYGYDDYAKKCSRPISFMNMELQDGGGDGDIVSKTLGTIRLITEEYFIVYFIL
jgi:hypothetical protein